MLHPGAFYYSLNHIMKKITPYLPILIVAFALSMLGISVLVAQDRGDQSSSPTLVTSSIRPNTIESSANEIALLRKVLVGLSAEVQIYPPDETILANFKKTFKMNSEQFALLVKAVDLQQQVGQLAKRTWNIFSAPDIAPEVLEDAKNQYAIHEKSLKEKEDALNDVLGELSVTFKANDAMLEWIRHIER